MNLKKDFMDEIRQKLVPEDVISRVRRFFLFVETKVEYTVST